MDRFWHTMAADKDSFQADFIRKDGVRFRRAAASPSTRCSPVPRSSQLAVPTATAQHRAIRPDDRLGLVLFHHQADVLAARVLHKLVGNFGLAILIVTVLVKLLFFPLANKSYESMSKMKKLQPEMEKHQAALPDDRMKQQQEMMELYKREKVSPLAGCLPVVVQIPVFFALYKVLYITIEMRHAPFFGWIRDLSAPDPTSLFNLFGLIPWTPPHLLMIGVWPIIMGITMWVQMQLNPTPPDPMQAQIFNWMPLIFTFMLAPFPAGLVIYWAWNNFLSILQQSLIMKRKGVQVDFFGNIAISLPFLKERPSSAAGSDG